MTVSTVRGQNWAMPCLRSLICCGRSDLLGEQFCVHAMVGSGLVWAVLPVSRDSQHFQRLRDGELHRHLSFGEALSY